MLERERAAAIESARREAVEAETERSVPPVSSLAEAIINAGKVRRGEVEPPSRATGTAAAILSAAAKRDHLINEEPPPDSLAGQILAAGRKRRGEE